MSLVLVALVILVTTGIAAPFAGRRAPLIGATGTVVAAVVALVPTITVLVTGERFFAFSPWQMPWGSLSFALDGLSALFLLPILVLGGCAAVYGAGYLKHEGRRTALSWLNFNLLIASMIVVCLADNTVLFLIAWETMALSSFLLVGFEREKAEVRKAAWIYMIATYLGTACLLPMFLLLGKSAGTLDFGGFLTSTPSSSVAGVCFVLALIGFGVKAGIMPFHVWLPEAHPAAPSHVSAIMSGVMIKTGIYGLLRIMTLLGDAPTWWGATLILVGMVSGIVGILFANAQRDLKRMLAYSSVENIGIILIGLGVGWLGLSLHLPGVAALGFAGGLLHVVNHALFKGLLFMGAGSVLHATGTAEIDRLGGLLRKMPVTGIAFLTGAIAICGLPPLNGFVGEFAVYWASIAGFKETPGATGALCAGSVAALALIGGLSVACFTKAFGIVFLGEPRDPLIADTHESTRLMTVPMIILATLCIAIGLLAPFTIAGMMAPVRILVGMDAVVPIATASGVLTSVTLTAVVLIGLVALLWFIRRSALKRATVTTGPTWDCGYARPTARMQYTASSFAQPLKEVFGRIVRTTTQLHAPKGYFPTQADIKTETPDIGNTRIFEPIFGFMERILAPIVRIQQGRSQLYLVYVIVALIALLTWSMR